MKWNTCCTLDASDTIWTRYVQLTLSTCLLAWYGPLTRQSRVRKRNSSLISISSSLRVLGYKEKGKYCRIIILHNILHSNGFWWNFSLGQWSFQLKRDFDTRMCYPEDTRNVDWLLSQIKSIGKIFVVEFTTLFSKQWSFIIKLVMLNFASACIIHLNLSLYIFQGCENVHLVYLWCTKR